MKTIIFLAASLCLSVTYGQADIILSSRPVSGGDYSNSNTQLSFTVGESAVGSIQGNNQALNQGLQQSFFQGLNSSATTDIYGGELLVFPNPFMSQITIAETNFSHPIDLFFFNSSGQKIRTIYNVKSSQRVNVETLDQGLYLIQAVIDRKVYATLSIIKI